MTDKMRLFFSGVKNPVLISEVRTALAYGYPIAVDRVPTELLPCVLFLAVIGRGTYREEILDEYELLFSLVRSEFEDKPFPGFWHPQMFLISSLAYGGPEAPYGLDTLTDAAYMFAVYEELRDERQVAYLRGKRAKGTKELLRPLPARRPEKKRSK